LLVFWPHSVFGQNHLYVRMLQTGIPLFRVKLEEFQSSMSAIQTMCHPVRTSICLLFHTSGRLIFPFGRQTDKHHLSGRRVSSIRKPTSYREASVPACFVRTFQQHAGRLSVLERFTDSFQVPRKERSINRPDAYLRKARIAVQNEPSGHLTAVVRTLVHRIW
jgi:hypothetical protein